MAKKSFKSALEDNPAASFLTVSEEPREAKREEGRAEPQGRGSWTHRDTYHKGAEAKTKRVNVLLRPSTYEAAQEAAEYEGLSFNGLVNRLLEDYLEEHKGQ